jgi:hypothetical protein
MAQAPGRLNTMRHNAPVRLRNKRTDLNVRAYIARRAADSKRPSTQKIQRDLAWYTLEAGRGYRIERND